jgi:hypothetical protein
MCQGNDRIVDADESLDVGRGRLSGEDGKDGEDGKEGKNANACSEREA